MSQVDALLHAVATKAYFLGDDKMGEFLEVFSSLFWYLTTVVLF